MCVWSCSQLGANIWNIFSDVIGMGGSSMVPRVPGHHPTALEVLLETQTDRFLISFKHFHRLSIEEVSEDRTSFLGKNLNRDTINHAPL